jgi:hypothetical protein
MERKSKCFTLLGSASRPLMLGLALCLWSAAPQAQQAATPDTANALDLGDCPNTATGFDQGKTYLCTCPASPSGLVYGSGTYTPDSNICVAAIHAGTSRTGAPASVIIRVIASPPVFKSATQNGVKSEAWPRSTDTAFQVAPAN